MNLTTNQSRAISAIELTVAIVVIALDLWMPTIVILSLIVITFLIRKEKFSAFGLKKPKNFLKMIFIILLLAIIWTIIQFSLTTPTLNHLSGTTQNLGVFESLKGNVGSLFYLLFLTWTLAAFGEEIVYRGYLQKRCRDIFGNSKLGVIFAVGLSSVLFGIAHLEQGIVGFIVTFVDAVFFSAIKIRYNDNLYAPILAHGFNNTIGFVTFFLIGPVYGLW